MNTMRFKSLVALGILLSAGMTLFTGCSDDDAKSTVLLRPVTTMESNKNSVNLKWQQVPDATEYIIELYRSTDTGYELYQTYTTDQTTYTIENLDWDEKYKLQVKSSSPDRESAYYETGEIAVSYPTKLGETKTIDNAARITWSEGGNTITALKVFAEDGSEVKTFTDVDYASGEAIINGLTPETKYKVCAYSGNEQSVSTYEGRVMIETVAAEDYDTQYGVGKWKDLRDVTDPLYFTNPEFWNSLEEGTAIIVAGGVNFHFGEQNGTKTFTALNKSITFATGLTLGENAKFIIWNAFALSTNVESLSFKNIDFEGAINDQFETRPVETETNKGFSAKQVFNENGSNTTLNTLTFTNCGFRSFRALVRLQAANDGVKNVIFKGCTINGTGDQGTVSTNGKGGIMDNITFEDCTITNVVLLGDLRTTANLPTLNILNCTFCYAPLEGTSNQLIRISKNPVVLNFENTIFGPPVAAGSGISPNTSGTQASRMTDSKGYTPSKATNCWATNFLMDSNCPFSGTADAGMNETSMFTNPQEGNFKIMGQFGGATSAGAIKWRN